MGLARSLVSGCDVWLNTPERPREASGTSGMKAAMNGILNLSVLDGWWDEAPHDEAGFVIGDAKDNLSDDEVVKALYDALEQRVLPMFFDRDGAGLPQRWIDRMIVSASKLAKEFSSERMVSDYLETCYVPGAFHRRSLLDAEREPLKRLVAWKEKVRAAWPNLRFESVEIKPDPVGIPSSSPFEVIAKLYLDGLEASDLSVELFEGPLEADGHLESGAPIKLELLAARARPARSASSTASRRQRAARLHGARPPDAPRPRASERDGADDVVGNVREAKRYTKSDE
jgi:starch phosphorylase